MTKLYVCDNDFPTIPPDGETISDGKTISDEEAAVFREAILRRDNSECVYCSSTTPTIEAAHVLTFEQKTILHDMKKRTLYGIYSIYDSSNGIALCWACHKCFDANLVCIEPSTGALIVTDALLANEPEKWCSLKGRIVSSTSHGWPNEALLKFREQAMLAATSKRNEGQSEYQFFCRYCTQGYNTTNALRKHEENCKRITYDPSSYKTPRKNPDPKASCAV